MMVHIFSGFPGCPVALKQTFHPGVGYSYTFYYEKHNDANQTRDTVLLGIGGRDLDKKKAFRKGILACVAAIRADHNIQIGDFSYIKIMGIRGCFDRCVHHIGMMESVYRRVSSHAREMVAVFRHMASIMDSVVGILPFLRGRARRMKFFCETLEKQFSGVDADLESVLSLCSPSVETTVFLQNALAPMVCFLSNLLFIFCNHVVCNF